MSHYYRNKQGNPCVSILESDNSGLHALVPIFSTYGYSDLPMIFQFAVSKTIKVYKEHYKGRDKISKDL